LDLWFVEHVAVTTMNFYNIESTGNDIAPAEHPIKMQAHRTQAPSDEHNPPIV
jgi:hypothetical protein